MPVQMGVALLTSKGEHVDQLRGHDSLHGQRDPSNNSHQLEVRTFVEVAHDVDDVSLRRDQDPAPKGRMSVEDAMCVSSL